jgi:hypothetical protein
MRTDQPADQPLDPPILRVSTALDSALRTREGHFEIIEIEHIDGLLVCVTAKQEPNGRRPA